MITLAKHDKVVYRYGKRCWHAYVVYASGGSAMIVCRGTYVNYPAREAQFGAFIDYPPPTNLPLCERCRINLTKAIVEGD